MEKISKDRKVRRMLFTKAYNKLDEKLNEPPASEAVPHDLRALFIILQERAEQLFALDERMKDFFLDDPDYDEDELIAEISSTDQYSFKWQQIKSRYEAAVTAKNVKEFDDLSMYSDPCCTTSKPSTSKCKGKSKTSASTVCVSCYPPKKSYHLPKIELRKFDGNLKSWLGFWGQFRKIDDDDGIDDDDKFQYLYQSTVPGSPARELVDSFPPSGANYKKAIEQLKERFARDDLLIEIYVRELLNLILAQTKQSAPLSLCQLYDKLKTQLHALETLGVTANKYAAMLLPLVESALPEDVLRAWQRAKTRPSNDSLENLLAFVKSEVESEERIKIACSGLNSDVDDTEIKVPTAACLASAEAKKTSAETKKKDACIWCSKSTHSSLECYKANKMSVDERKQSLSMKGACFNCLKVGHTSKICKNANKCIACGCKHSVLLCSELDKVKLNKTQAQNGESSQSNAAQKIGSTTFLQTLMVNVCNGNKSVRVRAFLDNGAQKSYIREDVAKQLHLQPVGQESLRHCLFGGITTDKETHNVFEFKVQGVNKEYEMTMTALEKKTCCGPIPRLQDNHSLLAKLEANNIVLSDCGPESPKIGLLIGSDYSGGLRTSDSITLEEPNLIVVKTKLGWTLQGPVRDANVANYSLTLANNIQIQNLWELEAIGINDPAETISRAKEESDAMDNFLEKVKINEEGRYEVDLPWKASNSKLRNNKELAEKRLTSTTKKLMKLDEFDSYDKVFREWLDLEIIAKAWIVLFTCTVYRAVHMEVTRGLSTQAFIMALRRFTFRRGRVKTLYSDNGTNFVGTYNLLKEMNWEKVAEYSNAKQVEWKFSPPSAPWWGGWWERMVRSVTPACFIHNMATGEVPDLDEIDEKSLNRRLRFINSVRRNLRARFRAEYTSMLIQKGKESSRTSTLRIGDVVLIESPGKRIDWPIAVVKELHEGRDGVARVAGLRTANGECTRAVKRLILLTSSDELLPPPGACSGSP